MKRAMMLFLAAGLLLSMTSGARAADVNIKGQWQNGFSWADRNPLKSANASVDRFKASTRLRTQIDIVASDSLKGVVFFEVGHQNWGTNDAALGTDGKVVKVRYSYVDWIIPETDAKVRMGLQPFDIATFAVPYAAFTTDGAGISLSGNFTENVGPRFFGFVRTITMNVLFPYMARTTRCCIHTTATMRWMSSGWRFRCSSMASG